MPHYDVLVVDDDVATRVLLERLLTRAGLSVVTASDGIEAAETLNGCTVDAVLLDLFMPRRNGSDLLEWIARERSTLLRHVILLSAAPEAALGEVRRKFPIWGAMRKPLDISDLLENVLDCLVQKTEPIRRPPQLVV